MIYEILDHEGNVVQGGFDSLEDAKLWLFRFKRYCQIKPEGAKL